MNKINKSLINIFKGLTLTSAFLLVSCNAPTSSSAHSYQPYVIDLDGEFTDDDYLIVKGNKLVNQNDEEIQLKGVNVGGLFVTESWMSAPRMSEDKTDHLTLTNTLYQRFGEEKTLKIWSSFREYFWSEEDLENCENMGINTIRIPFSYMSLDPAFHNVPKKEGQEFNFDALDEFVEGCARYHIYVILDLHGAYGSHNGQDHSGEMLYDVSEVDFFYNEEKQNKTIHLWEEIAKHYKGVNSIAAYDLLNEPGEKAGTTSERHWNFYDKLYDAIRKVDNDRPLIMESCWDGANLPSPSIYQWNNVIYSFHNYSGTSDVTANMNSFKNKLNGVYAQTYDVPFYMGEFSCYGSHESWRTTLQYLNDENWHWTSWTYKLSRHPDVHPGLAIYYSNMDFIYFDSESYEDILVKLTYLKTTSKQTLKMTFENGNTLENIFKTFSK